ncbi:hypothetical protein OJ996_13535 [Luteolibacter sp. GHJ8]|uniref:Uncharacterized protein n=1 Tax=Luteolibacter rhizosphaerae TaxID=2989719 RepID=A0ABT3G4X0_9BACT|nr:hypothetical protein [Luteolibacter rhizosphaerae]MCW1914604.1 hypothetical protein [Luteolibacter rhizosphaerae]
MNPARYLCRAVLVFTLLLLSPLHAESVEAEKPASAAPAKQEQYLPGVALSQGITEITGVAISPLLGVSSVGAWRYWHSPAEVRSALPWFCQPWAWGTGFVLLGLCFLKDSLGTAVPGVLKKPFDMVELFENKLSATVASASFVPVVATQMAEHFKAEHPEVVVPTAALIGASFAGIDVLWLFVPLSILAFLLVWICSHAINVLIILSPFSTVDAVLKVARASLLASVGLVYAIAPWLAAALCLVIIAIAAWLAPSALRLAIFGARFSADILLPWRGKRRATPEAPHAFTLGSLGGLPARTGGRLIVLEDGSTVFRYRRWCILDERSVSLPEGSRVVAKGILSPSLVHRHDDTTEREMLLFLPRYRGHEDAIAGHMKCHGVRDHALTRGFAAVKAWLKEILRRGKAISA